MKRYEFIEHTADVAIRAQGDSLEDAFAIAAQAMFDIITDNATIKRQQKVEFDVEAGDRESLLVSYLSRLIVVHEVDRLTLGHFSVVFDGTSKLHAEAWGEPFEQERHGRGTHVKAVAYHMLEIIEGKPGEPSVVQVLFDI